MTLTAVPRPRTIGLILALLAGAALMVLAPRHDRPAQPAAARVPLATAWPRAQRADLPGNLPDGPIFTPLLFLDARTAMGTAPSPDARSMRLLVRPVTGPVRELRRLPIDRSPNFGNVTASATDLVWTESSDGGATTLWTAPTTGGPARRLTADTGQAIFYGSQYDLVIADGRVHWVAAVEGTEDTEVRSVPLTGGRVTVRTEAGAWALSAWPWLTDGSADRTGATRLRNLVTGRDTEVRTSGPELTSCSPVWCRVLVMNASGLVRIDLMHPDGSARRRIAGAAGTGAVPDVALLDRFEVLGETSPDSGLTGTEGLLIYDIASGRTVDLDPAVTAAAGRGGVLWWSTGDPDASVWHTLDLRTV